LDVYATVPIKSLDTWWWWCCHVMVVVGGRDQIPLRIGAS